MTAEERAYHRQVWERRDAALRSDVLPIFWALLDRGVSIRVDDQRRIVVAPAEALTPEELVELRSHRDDVAVLAQLATDPNVVPKWQVM